MSSLITSQIHNRHIIHIVKKITQSVSLNYLSITKQKKKLSIWITRSVWFNFWSINEWTYNPLVKITYTECLLLLLFYYQMNLKYTQRFLTQSVWFYYTSIFEWTKNQLGKTVNKECVFYFFGWITIWTKNQN